MRQMVIIQTMFIMVMAVVYILFPETGVLIYGLHLASFKEGDIVLDKSDKEIKEFP